MDDKWFKHQQKIAGVTAEDIAEKLGRDRSVVSRIYVGRQKMTLDQARVFADVLGQPLGKILEKAGLSDHVEPSALFIRSTRNEATQWNPPLGGGGRRMVDVGRALNGGRDGVDIWQVTGKSMLLAGLRLGDLALIDRSAAYRAKAGDIVLAEVHDNTRGASTNLFRRYEPPVLVAASADDQYHRVHVVDGTNVTILGVVVASWRAYGNIIFDQQIHAEELPSL